MVTSSKMLIGIITFWILAQLICNFYEGSMMTENIDSNMRNLTPFSQANVTATTGYTAAVGTSVTAPTIGVKIWETLGNIFGFEYSMFKNTDVAPDAGGHYPDNDFVILKYFLIVMGAVMWLQFGIILFNAIGNLIP